QLQRWDQRLREGRAVAAGFGAAARDSRGEADALSYNAGISACEKRGQWQRALALLREICEAKLEPSAISSATTLESALARSAGSGSGLWRCCARFARPCTRAERPTSSAGRQRCPDVEAHQGDLKVVVEVHGFALVSYNAGISACEKGEQWQRALALLSEIREAKLEPDVIFSYTAGISACEKGKQWQRALALLSEIREAKLQPNVICYSAGITACESGEQWQQALALLSEMREAKVQPN
ncbi:unnamed protein product, partial [Prorocentrum cordatum]